MELQQWRQRNQFLTHSSPMRRKSFNNPWQVRCQRRRQPGASIVATAIPILGRSVANAAKELQQFLADSLPTTATAKQFFGRFVAAPATVCSLNSDDSQVYLSRLISMVAIRRFQAADDIPCAGTKWATRSMAYERTRHGNLMD